MTATAAQIIARARQSWTNNPDTDGSTDAFDYHIAIVGIEPFGELYQEVYAVANEGHRQAPVAECKERAARLWAELLPELESYAVECRNAKYTGWSRESGRAVRRVR